MKTKAIIILIFTVLGYNSFGQMMNSTVVDPKTNEKMLIGYCNLKGLQKGMYGAYFNSQFDIYNPNESVIKKLSDKIDDYEITVVLATWCIDSKREVPRLYKVLTDAGYNEKRVKVIAVDRNKEAVVVDIADLDIQRVPTIIVYKDDVEAGRIIEMPKRSIESDLWKIIK